MFTKWFVLNTLLTITNGVFIASRSHRKIFEQMKDFIQVVSSSKEANLRSAERPMLIPDYSPPRITNITLMHDGFQITVPGDGKLLAIKFYGRMNKPYTGDNPFEFGVEAVLFNKTEKGFVYQNRDFVIRANKTLYFWLLYVVKAYPNAPLQPKCYQYLADGPCNYTFKERPIVTY